jgi:hypothetical protein
VEFLQYPGETVFVPHGWLHAVLNLTPTVAVTQNYVSTPNLREAWAEARGKRPHMARRWREQMRRHEPHLLHMMPLTPQPSSEEEEQGSESTDPTRTPSPPGRRPDVDFEVAALDPDSWYWNPSSSEDEEGEDEEGEVDASYR